MAITKHYQIIPTLGEFGAFESFEGGELDVQTTDYYPAGARFALKVPGTASFTDITISRMHDPQLDNQVMRWVDDYANGITVPKNLTVVTMNDQNVVVASRTYLVKPKGAKPPAGKAGDGSPTEFSVTLAVEAMQ